MRMRFSAPIGSAVRGAGFNPPCAGPPIIIRISFLIVGLMLSSMIAASGQEGRPSQPPSQKAQAEAACESKCEAQYTDYKECTAGVAPMHSACDMYNECVHDCE